MDRRRLLTVILHYGSARTTARLHDHQLLRQAGMQEIRVLIMPLRKIILKHGTVCPENIFWAGALEDATNGRGRLFPSLVSQ